MKAAVFFERDGILNLADTTPKGQTSPLTLDDFRINTDARAALRTLKSAGFILIVISNQPGLSCGYLSRRELDLMHMELRRQFPLDDILICPHDEADECPCRKPKPGLLLEAGFKWHLDLDHSFVVSDKWQDAQAAHIAGCTSLLVRSPLNGSGHHDFVLDDLDGAVQKILQMQQPKPRRPDPSFAV